MESGEAALQESSIVRSRTPKRGDSMIARQGTSLLAAGCLSDWVTSSRDEYVTHAIARAAHLPRLAALRQELRDRVRGSPQPNGAAYPTTGKWSLRLMSSVLTLIISLNRRNSR